MTIFVPETLDGKEVTEMSRQFLKNWQANKEARKKKRQSGISRQSSSWSYFDIDLTNVNLLYSEPCIAFNNKSVCKSSFAVKGGNSFYAIGVGSRLTLKCSSRKRERDYIVT